MEILTYILVLIVCFISLFMGILISFIAKEELKDGKKYFVFSKNILFVLIIFFLFYFFKLNLFISVLISSILIFVLFKFKIREIILYNLLGIIFYLSSLNIDLFKINASLIFIYGLFVGSLFTEKNIKSNKEQLIKKLILNYGLFLVLGLLLGFL